MIQIAIATSEAEITTCFPVMQELRPHLDNVASFVAQVQRQQHQGYQLVYLEDQDQLRAVAGFRLGECLAWGKFLYVDDLVTQAGDRSQGYGNALFDWLVQYAKTRDCGYLQLDSGVQRFAAHRFYLRKRMEISSHHFSLKLEKSAL